MFAGSCCNCYVYAYWEMAEVVVAATELVDLDISMASAVLAFHTASMHQALVERALEVAVVSTERIDVVAEAAIGVVKVVVAYKVLVAEEGVFPNMLVAGIAVVV